MKKIKYCLILFSLFTIKVYAQTNCANAAPFCANNSTGSTFPAGVNNGSAAGGPNYGCLASQPNPAWYYFQVSQSGVIDIGIAGTGGGDVDFICWGPFTSPTGNCGSLTSGNIVDCSYSGSPTETCTINNAIIGQYYQLLLTNYSNINQNINFNQVGGTGSTNCGLIAPVTSATICVGQSATISANTNLASSTFVWNPGGLTTQTIVVSPSVTTVYSVTVNGLNPANTPTSVAGTGTVTVTAPIPVTITPTFSSICVGQSLNLNASGAGPFSWTASSGSNPASTGNIMVAPTIPTTYTVLSGVGSCTSTAVASVSITIPSTISVTPSLSAICAGETVTLTVSGSGPFIWVSSSGVIGAAASIAVTPTAAATYTVISGVGACSVTAGATVSILPTVTIAVTPSSTSICDGQSTILSSSGAGPFAWLASAGLAPPNAATVAVSPSVTTTYTVSSGIGFCAAQGVAIVNVLPAIDSTILTSSPFVCLSSTLSLSVIPGVGLTYTWQPSNSISGSVNSSTITAMPPGTATVIYSVTVSNGLCSSSDTFPLKVIIPPNIKSVITLNNDTICVGGCVTFSATTTGSAPIFYQWYYESGVGTSTVGVAPEACYPTAGTFSIVATASNACGFDTLRKPNFVTVYNIPALIVRGDTTINIGETATISASGALTYNWSPNVNGTIACPTCSNTVVQPTLTTQYIVTATNSKYCKVQDTVTVKVDINCGDFFVPNVFSPNDDGLNDLINVHGRCISTFNLQIFSRWGEKVFETSSLEDSWDGTFRGKRLDTGVFVYIADGVSIDGQSFKMKGNITLIR